MTDPTGAVAPESEYIKTGIAGLDAASSGDHRKTEAAGFEGHVNKPFSVTSIAAAVRVALARRHPSA